MRQAGQVAAAKAAQAAQRGLAAVFFQKGFQKGGGGGQHEAA